MSDAYDAWNAHVDRLRQVVLQSADVLPDDVAAYMNEVAAAKDWRRSKAVLAEPAALMRHLPEAFTDFALSVLVPRRASGRRGLQSNELEAVDNLEFFPPAHIQGPFLGLLRTSEEHGLRLVHGLANDAVHRWRASMEARGLTPLPVQVELPSGTRELWGDESVYYWFRTHGNTSNTVASALMALEAWMEGEIAAERPAEDLFDRVLRESECVAVAGACLSVALKYTGATLRAVLPLLSAPGLWSMDLVRAVHDGSRVPIFDAFTVPTLARHAHIEKLRSARDAETHRSRSVRELAMYVMVYGNEDLKAALDRAAARFTVDLPFRYAEEAGQEARVTELQEKMENFQALGVAANYQATEVDGRPGVIFEPPAELAARNAEAQAAAADEMLAISLEGWAGRARKSGTAVAETNLAEAVAVARRLHRPEDFTAPASFSEDGGELFRLRAIAGTAAAVLMKGYDWARENDALAWSRDVLLAAARTPLPNDGDSRDADYADHDSDPRVSAALGLGALIANGDGDPAVRQSILDLITDTRIRVSRAAIAGLAPAWDTDPVLCWNALALGLGLARVPMEIRPLSYGVAPNPNEAAWRAKLAAEAYERVLGGEIAPLPRIPREEGGWYFDWGLAPKLLLGLPLARLAADPIGKPALLRLVDDLMAWTVARNLPRESRGRRIDPDRPYEWNRDFMDWAAAFARFLPDSEVDEHILAPVRNVFEEAPDLTADLLKGYVNHHLGFMAAPPADSVRQWKEIAVWVLASERVRALAGETHMGHTIADAATLPIFVWQFGPTMKAEWPHTPLFGDSIGQWVETLGTNAYAFACLLMLLNGAGANLTPAPALEWVSGCVNGSDPDRLLGTHGNADRLAGFLQRVWHEHRDALLENGEQLARYSRLVDRLVGRGFPLASVLQRRLEEARPKQ